MSKSVFNLNNQNQDLASKITVGLQRISEVFKVLLWEKAKHHGLSPIQIQILIFIANHKADYCNVSYLAKEFNVTKPTISDAVRVLDKKALIVKDYSSEDSRRYSIFLSDSGKLMVKDTELFISPLRQQLQQLQETEQEALFKSISTLISKLNSAGILTVQRTCFKCKFYENNGESHYCNLLKKPLTHSTIRIDCAEFEAVD